MKLSPQRKIAAAATIGIITLAVGFVSFSTLPPPVDRNLHSDIGAALAGQATSLIRPGGKVTVICRDTATFPQPAMDVVVKSISRRMNNTEVSRLVVQIDPLRPAAVPPGDFFELLRKAKPDDVIVSLLGPPVLSDQQRFLLGGVRPKIVALCGGAMAGNLNLRSLYDAGLLHAAVVSKQFASATSDNSRHIPREFATLYQTFDSKALAALSPSAAAAMFDNSL